MRTLVLILLCILLSNQLSSQNLIPNGSFELVKQQVNDLLTVSRASFDSKVHSWYCPTNVSPDIYLPHPNNADFPDHFRKPVSKVGNHYIGLVLDYPYHVCKTYREYVQVKLKDTLEIGTIYLLEFWVSPRHSDTYNFGVFFDQNKETNDKCNILLNTPQLHFKDSLETWEWKKLSFEITPSQAYAYITVGNFEESNTPKDKYCYFDDFRLWKKGTNMEVSTDAILVENKILTNDLVSPLIKTPVVKTVFNANNIQFKHGQSNLTKTSLLELDHLITSLKEHYFLKILIEGHTDNSGKALVNQRLSTNRVIAVMDYMKEKGIASDRLRSQSHGAAQPIANNDTEEGRQLNRRVTFLIED